MPHFADADVAVLKSAALLRVPGCLFTQEDFEHIMTQTGLNRTQIDMWARHFRFKIPIHQRETYLQMDAPDEEKDNTQLKRCYVMAFNVTPTLIENLSFPKARGGGQFVQKYLFAGHNHDADSGELFLEFHEQIRAYQITDRLTDLGAKQVSLITFNNMDADESASDALARILSLGSEAAVSFITRGECSAGLFEKARSKAQQIDNQKKQEEFNEKTQLALRMSLEGIDGKVDTIADNVDQVKIGVCDTIADLRIEIARLHGVIGTGALKLAYVQKERDRLENKVGRQTCYFNRSEERGKQILELQHTNKLLTYRVDDLQKALDDKDRNLRNHIYELEKRLKDKDLFIDALKTRLAEKDSQLAEKNTQLAEKNAQLDEKDSTIRDIRAHDAATWLIEEERIFKKRVRDAMHIV